jgi:hypothetical protein
MHRRTVVAFSIALASVVPWPQPVAPQEPEVPQQPETLLGGERDLRFAWGVESAVMGIQDDVSATWGFIAGATVNGSTLVAVTLAANFTHPHVNYGYFGPLVRYTHRRDELVHAGFSLLLATASTKDYAREKSSLFDNFGNTNGERFAFVEPSVLGELNLTPRFRLRLGVGYRAAWGLDSTTEHTALTGVASDDFSGFVFTIGIGS